MLLLFLILKVLMMKKVAILVWVLGFVLTGCGEELKKETQYYDTDKTKPEKEIFYKEKENKKGRKQKIILKQIRYYPNGKIEYEDNYIETKDGGKVKNGAQKYYYENGQLKSEIHFVNGEFEGFFKEYYENGQLKQEGHYRSSKKSGIWKSYRENGQLALEMPYAEDGSGFLNGISKTYEDGSLLKESVYKDDRKFEEKSYYKNGQLHTDKYYNETGRSIGTWNDYFENGNLREQHIYDKNGEMVAKKGYCGWKSVRERNGSLENESYYFKEYIPKEYNENGVWDNLSREYFCDEDSGKLWTESKSSKDDSIGSISEYFYSSGVLKKKEVSYKEGGEWKHKKYEFFEDGSVHFCNDCQNGEAVRYEPGTFYLKEEAK